MTAWRMAILEVVLVVVLLPQAFVLCYFFPLFFHGGNQVGLLKSLALYGLTIAWVSAPFLALLTLLVRLLVRERVRWYVTFCCCIAAGYLWVAAWNRFVFDVFSYLRALLPIVLCSVGAAGWAMARALYLTNLVPPVKKAEPEALASGGGAQAGEPEIGKSPATDLSD